MQQQGQEADDAQSRVSRINQSEANVEKPREKRKPGKSSEKRTLGEKNQKVEKELDIMEGGSTEVRK